MQDTSTEFALLEARDDLGLEHGHLRARRLVDDLDGHFFPKDTMGAHFDETGLPFAQGLFQPIGTHILMSLVRGAGRARARN